MKGRRAGAELSHLSCFMRALKLLLTRVQQHFLECHGPRLSLSRWELWQSLQRQSCESCPDTSSCATILPDAEDHALNCQAVRQSEAGRAGGTLEDSAQNWAYMNENVG